MKLSFHHHHHHHRLIIFYKHIRFQLKVRQHVSTIIFVLCFFFFCLIWKQLKFVYSKNILPIVARFHSLYRWFCNEQSLRTTFPAYNIFMLHVFLHVRTHTDTHPHKAYTYTYAQRWLSEGSKRSRVKTS